MKEIFIILGIFSLFHPVTTIGYMAMMLLVNIVQGVDNRD